MTTITPTQIHRITIAATPESIWKAITDPEWTTHYWFRKPVEFELRPGGRYRQPASDQMVSMGLPDTAFEGEVLISEPPHRLVHTQQPQWEPREGVTTVTWEIRDLNDGNCELTVTHDLAEAPQLAQMVSGEMKDLGGWPAVLAEIQQFVEARTDKD